MVCGKSERNVAAEMMKTARRVKPRTGAVRTNYDAASPGISVPLPFAIVNEVSIEECESISAAGKIVKSETEKPTPRY